MKTSIRSYIHQFYRGNTGFLALACMEMLLTTAANMLISWLLQLVLDLVSGESIGFTLGQLALMTLGAAGLIALSAGCGYISVPRFKSRAMEQYKTYVFERLSRKGISAFSGENTSLYISALSNDAR